MVSARAFSIVCLMAGALGLTGLISADTYSVILRGKVTMPDGSPPPKSVGIQRVCSDTAGTAPGPITNKKGEFIWRMDVDPLKTRSCHLESNLEGYVSSTIDISSLNGVSTDVTLAPLVFSPRVADPYTIVTPEGGAPSRAQAAWKAAMKAIDTGNLPEATSQIQAALKAAPKFAQGWHALGVLYDGQAMPMEARNAYEQAIAGDPKFLSPYVTLARLCMKTKDWECVVKTADASIKVDTKRVFLVMYVHQAVARYQLKDLANAEASAKEAIKLDSIHKVPRAEFVLGRILEAKGDSTGAREHISKYIALEPNATDIAAVKAYLENLGKGTTGPAPELELL